MKKSILLILMIFSLNSYADYLPDKILHYDKNFYIQGYLENKKCWMANYYFRNIPASNIIKYWCQKYDVNAKFILNRMQIEYCALTGHPEGKYWIYPYPHKKKLMKYFLNEICGYGLNHKFPDWKKNIGFETQIKNCAKIVRDIQDEYQWSEYVLFIYDSTHNGGKGFVQSWKRLWPNDFKK